MYRKSHYILDENNNPVPAESWVQAWMWREGNERIHVGDDSYMGYRVSTVFLTIDHGWHPDHPPILFETMVFDERSGNGIYQDRYCTFDEAKAGHKFVLAQLKAGTLDTYHD